jgi:hypothetical protein
MSAFQYACSRTDGQFEGFEEALFQDFVGVLGVGEEDAALEDGVAEFFLEEAPVFFHSLQGHG